MQAQAHPVGRPPSASPPVLLEPDCVPTSMREREDETGYACTTCNGGGGRQSWECGVAATTSYLLPVHGTFYKTLQHLAAAAEAAVSTPDTESEPRIKARRIADISSRRGVPCATVECGCSVILFSCRRHVASARNHCTRKATQLCKDINHCKLQSTVSTTPQRCHATPLPRHDRRRLESPPSALRLLNIECAQIESTAHVRSKLESSLPGIIMYPRRKKKKTQSRWKLAVTGCSGSLPNTNHVRTPPMASNPLTTHFVFSPSMQRHHSILDAIVTHSNTHCTPNTVATQAGLAYMSSSLIDPQQQRSHCHKQLLLIERPNSRFPEPET